MLRLLNPEINKIEVLAKIMPLTVYARVGGCFNALGNKSNKKSNTRNKFAQLEKNNKKTQENSDLQLNIFIPNASNTKTHF